MRSGSYVTNVLARNEPLPNEIMNRYPVKKFAAASRRAKPASVTDWDHIPRPRIVTLDIETAPIVALVWSTWKVNVAPNQIVQDWSIMSFAAKWFGVDEVMYTDTSGQKNVRDDTLLLLPLWKILDAADIVVAQNGIKFDMKKINARFLMAGMPPPSTYRVVDTLLEARKIAKFTSNRLDFLADILTDSPKDVHSEFPGMELWKQCLAGNPKAWAAMRKYNIQDIISTEKVYVRMRPYIVGHPNVAAYQDVEVPTCPKCGSDDVRPRGFVYTQTGKYQKYHCGHCHGWSRGRYTENTMATRKSLLSN